MAVINGTEFDDFLNGTNLDDQIFGLEGGDWLVGGQGNDLLDGGPEVFEESRLDVASYQDDPGGVTVNLSTGTATDGWGDTDTLVNIESVADSAFDDTLIGNAGTNDFYLGQGGTDFVDGGDGDDVVVFGGSPAGVTVNLELGFAIDGQGNTDTILNVEAVNGSEYDDHITLTNGDNFALGNAGDDQIFGLDGSDYLIGQSGNDYLDGGAGQFDTASYSDNGFDPAGPITQGADVNLTTGIAIDGWGDTDTLVNIENVDGSQLDDTITGNEGSNFLQGREGNDVIDGGGTLQGEFDGLHGGDGDDTLTVLGSGGMSGDAGNDTIRGVGYNDFNRDFSRADYDHDPAGIIANLTAVSNGGIAGGDTVNGFSVRDGYGDTDNVAGVHTLMGSKYDDLVFVDSTYDNSFTAAGTPGTWIEVRPDAGNDQIFFDDVWAARISYSNSQGGVYADMEDGIARDLNAGDDFVGNDTFVGANEFRGSQMADEVYGQLDDDKRLRGQGGDDYIDGRSGNDRIEGENGNDTLLGGLGNDDVRGGSGDDVMIDNGFEISGGPATGPGKGLGHIKAKGKGHEKHEDDGTPGHAKHHDTEVILEDNDVYSGGSGDDLFVFGMNNGEDTITDFVAGSGTDDRIDVTAFGFSAFDDGSANDVESALSQVGADTVLDLGTGSVTLSGVNVADLDADDFLI